MSSIPIDLLLAYVYGLLSSVLDCADFDGRQIRIIVNDGVVPLTSIKGCPKQKDGLCPVATFTEAMKEMIKDTDWTWGCHGDWDVPEGDEWHTVDGYPPQPDEV